MSKVKEFDAMKLLRLLEKIKALFADFNIHVDLAYEWYEEIRCVNVAEEIKLTIVGELCNQLWEIKEDMDLVLSRIADVKDLLDERFVEK